MELWAHSVNDQGQRHSLEEHLRGTGRRAHQHAEPFGAGEIAGYLGVTHDVGKAPCEWQEGLLRAEGSGGRVGVAHKHAGTWLAERAGLGVLSGVVFGHHGGLPSLADLKSAVRAAEGEYRPSVQEAVDRVGRAVPEIHNGPGLPTWLHQAGADDPLVVEVLVRMVFSAVVDADYLDTEEHFGGAARPEHDVAAMDLVERYEQARGARLAQRPSSPVDTDRARVYEQAVEAAQGPQGFYRLPAPTGSGKTFAAGGFGLHHARVHGLRRVVVAVPYMSITEQNAQEYRGLLESPGQTPVVLEHHSGVDLDGAAEKGNRWGRLAAENWDAPFIVTTTVRLFESLFDHRPAAMRRLHRLAGSVIVLDEVQALPDRLLVPIMSMLRTLTEHFRVTVLLASATQPAFFELGPLKDVVARDVIAQPKPLYERLSRVAYEWWTDPAPTRQELAHTVAGCASSLTVCNTTTQSRELHELVDKERPAEAGPVLHLSTRMVARHRRETIQTVRELNEAGHGVAVISTQLVEAGVDLDFPEVFRAYAPAEAMQQAAGRCNRSGRLERGRVVVFELADEQGGAPSSGGEYIYGAALGATRMFFGADRACPDDLDALEAYYRERFKHTNVENDGATIQRARRGYDFPEVANLFEMIRQHTVPVVVPHAYPSQQPRIHRLLRLLREGVPSGGPLRELRPYIATLPKSLAHGKAVELMAPVVGDLYEWLGDYDERRGIEISDSQEYVF